MASAGLPLDTITKTDSRFYSSSPCKIFKTRIRKTVGEGISQNRRKKSQEKRSKRNVIKYMTSIHSL